MEEILLNPPEPPEASLTKSDSPLHTFLSSLEGLY
jgi:hypothetical protein